MSGPSWEATLDAFEECLAVQRELLLERRYAELVAFVPPAGLGPLPGHLVPRAMSLLREAESVAAEAQRALEGTGRTQSRARRALRGTATQTPRLSAFLDRQV